MVGHERRIEWHGSANNFDQLERRLKKDKREISVNTLLGLNVRMLSLTHRCDRLCRDEVC